MYDALDIAGGALIAAALVVGVIRNSKSDNIELDKRYFRVRWLKLQKLCSDRKTWYQAIIDADNLLDEALKQRHFKGKTTGERMVSAQHYFSSNDALWLSHKLKNKISDNSYKKLGKRQTLDALEAYKLALKDIGALGAERKTK